MSLGKNIAALRKEKGLTQAQLGELLGVSNKAVSKWELDINLPDVMLLPQIAKVFEVSIDWLFEGNETEEEAEISDKLFCEMRQEYDGGTLISRFPNEAMYRMIQVQLEAGSMQLSAEEWKEFWEVFCQPGVVMDQKQPWGSIRVEVMTYEN